MNTFCERYPNLGALINKEEKRYKHIKEFIERKRPKLQRKGCFDDLISLNKEKLPSFDPKESTYHFKKYVIDKNVNLYAIDIKFNNVSNKIYKAIVLTTVDIKRKSMLPKIDEGYLGYRYHTINNSEICVADYFIVNTFGKVPHIEYVETDISHWPDERKGTSLSTTVEYFASGVLPWVTLWFDNPVSSINSDEYGIDWSRTEKAVKETFKPNDDTIKLLELTDGSQCYDDLEKLVKPFQYSKKLR